MGGFNSFDFSQINLNDLPKDNSGIPTQKKKKKKKGKMKKQQTSMPEKKPAVVLSEPEPIQKRKRTRPAVMPPVFAPYNFVSLPDQPVILSNDEVSGHNQVDSDLVSGEINYKITARTSIFIDDGTDHFYKNAEGCYTIPGSSVRGLIRSNAQILSLSSTMRSWAVKP